MRSTSPILVVDDEERLLHLVVLLLNRIGFSNVEGATGGVQALERLHRRRCAVVISDLNMEPMNGIDLLREIRADRALAKTPFILTEVSFDCEAVTAAYQEGADAFILKPFDAAILKSKLHEVSRSKSKLERNYYIANRY